jgi:hypothetical protein
VLVDTYEEVFAARIAAMISSGGGNRPPIFSATFLSFTHTVNSPELPGSMVAVSPSCC